MANNYFQFKQFKIIQEHSAMKVGTDGVLLGAWANCANTKTILDIGCGTGVIALMLAQRSGADIDAVEIDENAFYEAKINIDNSPWNERVQLHYSSIQDFAESTKTRYDLIVSNPPFFAKSMKADNKARNYARHDDSLHPKDLFLSVAKLLNNNGRFCVVIPRDNYDQYCDLANMLYCTKTLWVKPTPEKDVKRVLLEFTKLHEPSTESTLIIEDKGRHGYSEDYKLLTKDFYLAF